MNRLSIKSMMGAIAVATAVLASPVSYAGAFLNEISTSGINTVEDTNVDRVLRLDANNVYQPITAGEFQVGDVFQAILRFDNIFNLNGAAVPIGTASSLAGGDPNYSLWAYSEIRIATKADLDLDNNGLVDAFAVTFDAPNFLNSSGAMIELYETTDPTAFQNFSAAPDVGIAAVRGYDLIAEFGLVNTQDFWQAIVPIDISALDVDLASGISPSGEFGLSFISNDGDLNIDDESIFSSIKNDYHAIIGESSTFARGEGVDEGWLVSTDTDVSYAVPEPNVIALMGAALLMGGIARYRRA